MSPYADELAHARLEALRQLIDAMREAEDPAEKRRCAVAIFNAPDPTDLDDQIELEDDEDTGDHNDKDDTQNQRAPSVSERVEAPSPSASPIAHHSPSSLPSLHTQEIGEPSMVSIDDLDDLDDPDDLEEDPFPHIPTEQLLAQATAALQQLRALNHPG